MLKKPLSSAVPITVLACCLSLLGACSGSREDVRVTFCKDLISALQSDPEAIEWTGEDNTFQRPEFAVTELTFDVMERDGGRGSRRAACHYAYDALEDTAVNLAYPFDAYATLPYKMTLDGVALSDAELLRMINAEQKRRGRQALQTLQKGVEDAADKVRAGIGQ